MHDQSLAELKDFVLLDKIWESVSEVSYLLTFNAKPTEECTDIIHSKSVFSSLCLAVNFKTQK